MRRKSRERQRNEVVAAKLIPRPEKKQISRFAVHLTDPASLSAGY